MFPPCSVHSEAVPGIILEANRASAEEYSTCAYQTTESLPPASHLVAINHDFSAAERLTDINQPERWQSVPSQLTLGSIRERGMLCSASA